MPSVVPRTKTISSAFLALMNFAARVRAASKAFVERLLNSFASPENDPAANGSHSVTLRLPKKLHQALLAEAAAEGVKLDQLCLSKLVVQLRELN